MEKEIPKLLPVTILLTSFNRMNLLKKTIESINERTFYPFRIIIIDNASTDGSVGYLKTAKVHGKIFDHVFLPENIGQSKALNIGFTEIEKWEIGEDRPTRPSNDFVIATNEDILPPYHRPKCWLEQMIEIFEKYEEEDGLGSLAMRIQRMSRADIDESKDIIYWNKGIPAVFRLMRRSDIRQLGNEPMGRLLKWNGNTVADKLKLILKKRYGFTTHLYSDHIGFIPNKGFPEGTETFTVAANKANESSENPYPDINPLTNEPIKINCPKDAAEQKLRDEYHAKERGELVGPETTIIILTCKRYDGLKRIVDSVKANTDVLYELLVVADNDDTEAYNYCLENDINCLLSSYHRDFVAQANLGIYACKTPYFVLLSDDSEIVQSDWLSRSLKVFKERFPDSIGLLAFNDGIQNGKLFTMGMSSKKFVEEMRGHLYYPGYKHYGGDREVSRLAKEMKCYHYDDSINVVHYHPGKEKVKDETYRLSEDKFWHQDQKLKKERGKIDLLDKRNYYEY